MTERGSQPPPSAGSPVTVAAAPSGTKPSRSAAEKVLIWFAVLAAAGFLAIVAFWWLELDDRDSRRALAAIKDDPVRGFTPPGYRLTRKSMERQKLSPDIILGGNPEDRFAHIQQEFAARGSDDGGVTRAMTATAEFARRHGYHVEPTGVTGSKPSDCMNNACTPEDEARMSPANGFIGLRGDGDRRTSIRVYPLDDRRFSVYLTWDAGPRYVDNAADDLTLAAVRRDPMADYVPIGADAEPTSIDAALPSITNAFEVSAERGAVPSAIAAGRAAEARGWQVDWDDSVRWMPDGARSYPARFVSGTKTIDGTEIRLQIAGTEYEDGRHKLVIEIRGPARP